MKTTNYFSTFIEVADDCPADVSKVPSQKNGKPTVASLQFELLQRRPYELTSDDLLFQVHAIRNDIREDDIDQERQRFFSRGQACLRTSALAKRYGWGIHSDDQGRVALVPVEAEAYGRLVEDRSIKHLKAMRSGRK